MALIDLPAADLLAELARQVDRRGRALVAEAVAGPLTKPPYKFLDYYESDDRDIFYGRQIESVRFFRLVLSHRLTVLFGASGTGKTSLLKAGVLPNLREDRVACVRVEATPSDTEARLAAAIDRQLPDVPRGPDLAETFRQLRRGSGVPGGRKVLIVLDQFEQWLHGRNSFEREELVRALRQCDGGALQGVVSVRAVEGPRPLEKRSTATTAAAPTMNQSMLLTILTFIVDSPRLSCHPATTGRLQVPHPMRPLRRRLFQPRPACAGR